MQTESAAGDLFAIAMNLVSYSNVVGLFSYQTIEKIAKQYRY